jgi:hypothetical protein
MKKRKPPVLLVSILVLLVAGIVMFGMKSNGPIKDVGDATPESHDSPSAGDLKKNVDVNAKKSREWAAQRLKVGADDAGPSIAHNPGDNHLPKPTPDPSGRTDSGWYLNH